MKARDLFGNAPEEAERVLQSCRGNSVEDLRVLLNTEHELVLFADSEPLKTFICSPAQLAELCAGWLFSEGYAAKDGIEDLTVEADGRSASAVNVSAPDAQLLSVPQREVSTEDIRRMLELFGAGAEKYTRTHGVHECVLSTESGVFICVDIGRYNAIDKAIGTALLQGADVSGGMLFTSGRISEATVRKAARCGISVLMSKAVVTAQALALAQELGIKVFFSVKGERYITV